MSGGDNRFEWFETPAGWSNNLDDKPLKVCEGCSAYVADDVDFCPACQAENDTVTPVAAMAYFVDRIFWGAR